VCVEKSILMEREHLSKDAVPPHWNQKQAENDINVMAYKASHCKANRCLAPLQWKVR